jgi:hypothetical protein
VYNVIERLEAPVYSKSALPEAVRGTLYNLADEALVPGQQVVFYAFNYGDTPALCYLLENDKSCTVVQSPRP